MNVLIIEDELMSAEDLAEMVKTTEESVKKIDIVSSVKEAIAYFNNNTNQVDLIFSDIELGDGTSFSIFSNVVAPAPIIFCTAYDQYAIEAFKANSIEYILKPFDRQSVTNAISKYLHLKNHFNHPETTNYNELLQQLMNINKPATNSILIYQREKVFPIKLEDVALFYIGNEITHLIDFDNKSHIITQTLDELEKISQRNFFRVNRQYLVNRSAIKDAAVYFNRKYLLTLSIDFPENIIVSKNRVGDFLQWLTQL